MSGQDYRDGRAALREENAVLEQELEAREAELQRREAEIAARDAALAAKDAELARLQAMVPQTRTAAVMPDGKRKCAGCGRINEAHYKFCLGCGEDLENAVVVTGDAPPTAMPISTPDAVKSSSAAVVIALTALIVAFGAGIAMYLAISH